MEWQPPVEIGPGVGFQVRLDEARRCWWRLVILSNLHSIYSEERVLTTNVVHVEVHDVPMVNTFGIYVTYDDGSVCIPARVANGGVYFVTPIHEIV